MIVLIFLGSDLSAQVDSISQKKPELSISGFADVFYVYDFNEPPGAVRQSFLYNHNRHQELNLNLGFIKFGITHAKYRSNLALLAGTYAIDNYAAEPDFLKNIFEANVGISLNRRNSLWLDAGVFPSHLGFESAISMENTTLTRSLLAENSPYFFTGAKLTYNPTKKLEMAGLVLNGWQRIKRLQGNSLPSFGTQVKYKPTQKVTLNWSTFIGTDDPDSTRRMRYFNNFYGQYQVTEKFALLSGFDLGAQQSIKNSSVYELWFSPVLIGQYVLNKTWKAALRAEYYQDKTGIIIPTSTANGFQTTGLSLNLDYAPNKSILCRLEGRWLHSKVPIYETKSARSNNNFILAASIALKFRETLIK